MKATATTVVILPRTVGCAHEPNTAWCAATKAEPMVRHPARLEQHDPMMIRLPIT